MLKKIQKLRNLKKIIIILKKQGKKIAFTNGCFDILHYGHVKYLRSAKALADILVVAVNSDTSVGRIKGRNRPITPLMQRMAILAALEDVDFIISFNNPTPYNVIKSLKPDFLIKGGDWKGKNIVGNDIVKSYGGKVISLDYIKRVSTTGIINKIVKKIHKP